LIPTAYLQEWSSRTPWPDFRQVEQDLIICRVLCDLFNSPALAEKIAFRGGTAIHKLLLPQPLRYSEDIDLVQTQAAGVGATVDAIRDALSWLGRCKREQTEHSMHMIFAYVPEAYPESRLKLKIEINTREHESLYPIRQYHFELDSSWHSAQTDIASFEPEEVFGTKLRALLQRRRHRDLFDLHKGLKQLPLDCTKIIACLQHYLSREGRQISRADAERRMLEKLAGSLTEDIAPLLPAGVTFTKDDAIAAFGLIWFELVQRLPGEAWKLSETVIGEARKRDMPNLLR
jgi:predicted nucleotidyltransferase component of viral defense system